LRGVFCNDRLSKRPIVCDGIVVDQVELLSYQQRPVRHRRERSFARGGGDCGGERFFMGLVGWKCLSETTSEIDNRLPTIIYADSSYENDVPEFPHATQRGESVRGFPHDGVVGVEKFS